MQQQQQQQVIERSKGQTQELEQQEKFLIKKPLLHLALLAQLASLGSLGSLGSLLAVTVTSSVSSTVTGTITTIDFVQCIPSTQFATTTACRRKRRDASILIGERAIHASAPVKYKSIHSLTNDQRLWNE